MDLNRNYDFKWGFDDEGSSPDPCDETFRGERAFSEPETAAVRRLVESAGKISSAMNFHAWGNLWITPFCYYKGRDYEKLMDPLVFEFYRDFEARIRALGFAKAGSAEETIRYVANGEASDWLLGVHGVIALSPELGDDRAQDDVFYPPAADIPRVLDFDWPVVALFLERNRPIIEEVRFGFFSDKMGRVAAEHLRQLAREPEFMFQVQFTNRGILDLLDLSALLNFFEALPAASLQLVTVLEAGRHRALEFQADARRKLVAVAGGISVPRLARFSLCLWFDREVKFEFALRLLKNGREVARIASYTENAFADLIDKVKGGDSLYLSLFLISLSVAVLLAAVLYLYCRYQRKVEEQAVIEIVNLRREQVHLDGLY